MQALRGPEALRVVPVPGRAPDAEGPAPGLVELHEDQDGDDDTEGEAVAVVDEL